VTAIAYGLIYLRLNDDAAVARIASLACAAVTGYFILLNIAYHNFIFATLEVIAASCLLYAFINPPSQPRLR